MEDQTRPPGPARVVMLPLEWRDAGAGMARVRGMAPDGANAEALLPAKHGVTVATGAQLPPERVLAWARKHGASLSPDPCAPSAVLAAAPEPGLACPGMPAGHGVYHVATADAQTATRLYRALRPVAHIVAGPGSLTPSRTCGADVPQTSRALAALLPPGPPRWIEVGPGGARVASPPPNAPRPRAAYLAVQRGALGGAGVQGASVILDHEIWTLTADYSSEAEVVRLALGALRPANAVLYWAGDMDLLLGRAADLGVPGAQALPPAFDARAALAAAGLASPRDTPETALARMGAAPQQLQASPLPSSRAAAVALACRSQNVLGSLIRVAAASGLAPHDAAYPARDAAANCAVYASALRAGAALPDSRRPGQARGARPGAPRGRSAPGRHTDAAARHFQPALTVAACLELGAGGPAATAVRTAVRTATRAARRTATGAAWALNDLARRIALLLLDPGSAAHARPLADAVARRVASLMGQAEEEAAAHGMTVVHCDDQRILARRGPRGAPDGWRDLDVVFVFANGQFIALDRLGGRPSAMPHLGGCLHSARAAGTLLWALRRQRDQQAAVAEAARALVLTIRSSPPGEFAAEGQAGPELKLDALGRPDLAHYLRDALLVVSGLLDAQGQAQLRSLCRRLLARLPSEQPAAREG